MKHYIGEIVTMFSESEVNTMVKFKTDIDPDLYLEALASKFWGKPFEHEKGDMYDFGDKATCGGDWQEVDAKIYNKLKIIQELRT